MNDSYDDIYALAKKLHPKKKPVWYDVNGCPRWEAPNKRLKPYIRRIRCQNCSKIFIVCLVHPVYLSYGYHGMSGELPKHWYYKDPPRHDCVGDTMTSIPEWEWREWKFSKHGAYLKVELLEVKGHRKS